MNAKLIKLLNDQINKEFFSAYLYLDISNYYNDKNLNGFGNWFAVQAREEQDHALLFSQFLLDNSIPIKLKAIAAPDKALTDFRAPLVAALEHEKYVTASINTIYEEAHSSKDYRTMQFLDWFIKEQLKEEKNADELIARYDLFGTDAKGLYMLDAEMKTRVYVPPSLVL